MASSEITRVVTGKSSIPEFDTITGTVTTDATVSTALNYTGALTAQDVFGAALQKGYANNLYVYESASTNGSLRRITGVNTADGGITWGIQIESAFASPLSSENLKIVTADLNDYSVANTGGASGVYDEVAYPNGLIINRNENSNRRAATENRIAKAINATGTSFFITENK